MAGPLLHIKDGYFFEVPRALWPADYKSLEEVPTWAKGHSLEQINTDLSGKILIPQPFGTIKNLFEPESGFCISRFMILEVVGAILVFWLFYSLAKRIRGDAPPTNRGWNLVESLVVFVKEGIVEKAIPHGSEKYFPLLATFFFFILTLNLIGMIPWLGAATGAISLTITLGATVFVAGLIYGSQSLGPIGYWKNYVPAIVLPWYMYPLQILLVIMITGLEIFGALIKHAVLGLRLMINMAAGHLVLISILSIITAAAVTAETYGQWLVPAMFSTLGSTLLSVMELGVAFLQAFVFTLLAALFINSATHSHTADHGDDHAHDAGHAPHTDHEPALAHSH